MRQDPVNTCHSVLGASHLWHHRGTEQGLDNPGYFTPIPIPYISRTIILTRQGQVHSPKPGKSVQQRIWSQVFRSQLNKLSHLSRNLHDKIRVGIFSHPGQSPKLYSACGRLLLVYLTLQCCGCLFTTSPSTIHLI